MRRTASSLSRTPTGHRVRFSSPFACCSSSAAEVGQAIAFYLLPTGLTVPPSIQAAQMISLEDELIETLRDSAKVDGHDVGSGEVNIFIFTTEPQKTFQLAKHALERRGCLQVVTAAY